MEIRYRPEIDGLRTIAVLSVIIYHAEFAFGGGKLLPGGFLGVDVFFVISGFLITSLMMKEFHKTGTISITSFYERRARRLLPALLLVMLASLPFAWMYLLPDQLIDYAKSLISSLLFGSNFYWDYSLQEYGAESGLLKPFLHTWSLAVEEQYYIVFPLILLAIYKWCKSHTIVILTAGLLLSLQFAEWMTPQDSSFSFYMLPSRFWELLAGGLLANVLHLHPQKENDALLNKTMPVLGLFLILHSVIFTEFDSRHPGFITLAPVIGTMLIIWFANKDELTTKLLSSKAFVSIGLISYSLYLWHYPIFSFFRMEGLFDSPVGRYAGIGLTFVLSIISVRYVESFFRSRVRLSNKVFLITCIMLSLITGGISYLFISKNGFPERYKGLALEVGDALTTRKQYWSDRSRFTHINDFSENQTSIEVIGNSWAHDIAISLTYESHYQVGYRGMTGHKCSAITLPRPKENHKEYDRWKKKCLANNKRFSTKLANADLVIIADDGTLASIDNEAITKEVLKNIGYLRENGYLGPILVIASRPIYDRAVFSIIKGFGSVKDAVNIYAQRHLRSSIEDMNIRDKKAQAFYFDNDIHYFSLVGTLCQQGVCKIASDGHALYHDKAHLTSAGARYIGEDLSAYIEKEILNSIKDNRDN